MMNKIIFEKWKKQVECNSNKIAMISGYMNYTYEQLHNMILHISKHIRLINEDKVIVKMESSMEYWITVMAILKEGKTFIPIDINVPEERIQYISKNAETSAIIDRNKLGVFLDNQEMEDTSQIQTQNGKVDIAYILFTSGTTGNPKGVMIATESLLNLTEWFGKKYQIDNKIRILQLANISFDVSIEEYFGILLNGGCVVIPDRKCKNNPVVFEEYINRYKINIVQMIPRMADFLVANTTKMNSLKHIIVGAEQLDKVTKQKIIEKGYLLHNHYGPTEATVDALVEDCIIDEEVNIGKPIDNMYYYIADKDNNEIITTGEEGELILFGTGIAVGYYNNIEETKRRFFEWKGYRAYRTGDLVKLNNQKKVVFVGRNDGQIKINGKRIELGEIQTCAKEHVSRIGDCAAYVITESDRKIIVLYWTGEVEETNIKENLMTYLPDYMLPVVYIKLDTIPTTSNDKIDQEKLRLEYENKKISVKDNAQYEVSRDGKKIIKIISEMAEIEEDVIINSMDSTLEQLGMDSLVFVQILLEIEDEFDLELDDDFLVMDDVGTINDMIQKILRLKECEDE